MTATVTTLPFAIKTTIIKYLSDSTDYKQYCDTCRTKTITKLEICPHCGRKNCLIGHGFYKRKGIGGVPDNCYSEFFIKRYLCKKFRKTVSIHPVFSHTYKRYVLSFVVKCLSYIIKDNQKISHVSKNTGIARQTLSRWKNSFSNADREIKKIFIFEKFRHQSFNDISLLLLECTCAGVVMVMASLHDSYNASLY